MTTTFTPGPWRIDDWGFLKENGEVLEAAGRQVCPHCHKAGSPAPVQIQILGFDKRRQWGVCQLGSYDPKLEYQQHLANARLIAAAPDLFEAAKLTQRVIAEALPKFNLGASALDANAIRLLNELPNLVNAAVARADGRLR